MKPSNSKLFIQMAVTAGFPELPMPNGYRACIAKHFPNKHTADNRQFILAGCKMVTGHYKTFGRLVSFGVPREGTYFGRLYKNPLETYRGYLDIYFVVSFGILKGMSSSIEELYELIGYETKH